jgi:hypothetical protein
MIEYDRLSDILRACWVGNEFQGLDEFRAFLTESPAEGFELAWQKVAEWPDLDEGQTIGEVLRVLSDVTPDTLRDRLFGEWPNIDRQHRSAITYGAGYKDILSLDDWLCLFEHASSTVQDRHWIIAAIVSASPGRPEEFRPYAEEYLAKIGQYEEDWHNDILNGFLEQARTHYGLPRGQ